MSAIGHSFHLYTHFFNKFHDHQVLFKFSKHGSWVSQDTIQQNQGSDLPPPKSVGTHFVAKEYAKIGHSKGRYLATKKASLSYTTRFSPENLLSVGPTKKNPVLWCFSLTTSNTEVLPFITWAKTQFFLKYQFDFNIFWLINLRFRFLPACAPICQSVRVCHSSKCAIPNSFAIDSASKRLETNNPTNTISNIKKKPSKGCLTWFPVTNIVQFTIPDS